MLLVGDQALMRAALHALIQQRSGIRVIGELEGNAGELDSLQERPDIVLIDINDCRPDSWRECLPRLSRRLAPARIIVLTCDRERGIYPRIIQLGAMGVVFKGQPKEVLFRAIEKIHEGELWLERSMMTEVVQRLLSRSDNIESLKRGEASKIASVTKREREIIALVGEGLRNNKLAQRLCISETTVRHHLTSIYDKLGVSDRLELAFYAYKHGLAKPPES